MYRLKTLVPDLGDDSTKFYVVINGDWFELDKQMFEYWSPFLVKEIRMNLKERQEQEDSGGVLASFYPEPPLFVNIDTCIPAFPTTSNSIATSDGNGTPASMDPLHAFNRRIFELFAFQTVDFSPFTTVNELLCYTVILCTSGVPFDGQLWLDHLNQLIYPKDVYDAVDIVQTFLRCLEDHGRLPATVLQSWLESLILQYVPYFQARYELMRQLERVRRRYPIVFTHLHHVFISALDQYYPQCKSNARQCAQQIFNILSHMRDIDGDAQRGMQSMIVYQQLFSNLDTQNCLQSQSPSTLQQQGSMNHKSRVGDGSTSHSNTVRKKSPQKSTSPPGSAKRKFALFRFNT